WGLREPLRRSVRGGTSARQSRAALRPRPLIDHAHAAAADLAEDAVVRDGLTDHGWRRTQGAILGMLRSRSQRGAAHRWMRERANPVISSVPEPSPIRWSERVSAATSFYEAFRPLFRQIGRWCTGIPLGHPFERLHCGASSAACWEETKGSIPELACPTETQTVQKPELCPRQGQSGFSQISTNSSGTIRESIT